MKNKKLKIFLCFIIILVYIKFFHKPNSNTTSDTTENTSNMLIGLNTTSVSREPINVNGENSGIYVGTGSTNYNLFSVSIDKTKSNEEQALEIISHISKTIGYTINVNSLEFEENKIKIDLDSKSAPITIEGNYIGNYEELYVTYDDTAVVYSCFDSIYKSFKDYFGYDYEIYFSSDNQNISLVNIDNGFSIDMNTPYEPIEE